MVDVWGDVLRCQTAQHLQTVLVLTYERPHDETNKMAYAHSEDSDQSGHPPSLISLLCALNG